MKQKVITTRDFAAIKKMAQIVNPLVSKKATILKKIAALTEEIEGPEGLDTQIAGMEAGIKARFLGMGTEDLIKKVVVPAVRNDGTPVLDPKTGKQMSKTTWEPTDLLTYNEDKNNYTLTVDDGEGTETTVMESTEEEQYDEAQAAIVEQQADENSSFDNPFGY